MTDWQIFLATLRIGLLRFAMGFAVLALAIVLVSWLRQRRGH